MTVRCDDCRYWSAPPTGKTVGECRRYPPVVLAEQSDEWPWTGATDWCGEFVALVDEDLSK